MKICIFGNSHAGSLIRAWESLKDKYSDYSIDFFALRSNRILEVEINKQNFGFRKNSPYFKMLKNMSGKTIIDPSTYNLFIVYLPIIDGDTSKFGSVNFPPSQHFFNSVENFFSREEQKNAIDSYFKEIGNGYAAKMAKKLKNETTKPIYVVSTPLKSKIQQKYSFRVSGSNSFNSGMESVKKYFEEINLRFIYQPKNTIEGMFTISEYSKKSRDITGQKEHGKSDNVHMNENFGKLMLNNIFNHIK